MSKRGKLFGLFSKTISQKSPVRNWPREIPLPFPHNPKFLILLPFDEKFYRKCDLFLHPHTQNRLCEQRGFELVNFRAATNLLSNDILEYLCPGEKDLPVSIEDIATSVRSFFGRKAPKIILLQYSDAAQDFIYFDLSNSRDDLVAFNIEKIIYSIPRLKEPEEEEFIRYRYDGYDISKVKQKDDSILFAKSPKIESKQEKIPFPKVEKGETDGIHFSIIGTDIDDAAKSAEEISASNETAIKEFVEKYNNLRKIGISDEFLQSLLNFKRKASRLRITSSGRIYLVDYGNREVKMDALTKTVYFLYLKHPEGIRFKSLVDFREELFQIYSRLSNRSDIDALRTSVERLTDPEDNSINEKTTKANKAFLAVIEEESARVYYIDGHKGEDKSISLDRTLVIWE